MRVCLRRRPVRRGRLPGAPRTRITARGSDICLPLALLLAGSAAGAEDRNPPPWRGQPLTTFQHWTFNQPPATYPQTEDALDCGPQPPDKSFNPYATGTKDLYLLIRGLDPPKTEWLDTMLGMQGVWRLEKTTWQDLPFFGYLSFFIANANRPGHAKEIRVQVTSMEVAGPPQVLAYLDLPPPAVIIVRMEPEGPPIQLANGATHRTFVGRAPGCPPKDTVNIWHPFNLQHPQESSVVYVDQVVVDTICRPADKKRPDKRRR